jgi:hypothetical protein
MNCLLKHVIEGTIEGAGRLDRRGKQLLDDLKEGRKIMEFENLWRNRFG